MGDQFRRWTGKNNLPAIDSGSGAHIDHIIRSPNGFLVMFYDQHRIAKISHLQKGFQQTPVIAPVKTDTRFIQYIKYAG